MYKNHKTFFYFWLSIFTITGILMFLPGIVFACGGTDVILLEDVVTKIQGNENYQFDEQGNLLLKKSIVKITPEHAQAIAERFLIKTLSEPPLPLTFRKLEQVHGMLIYQFQSQPLDNFNGIYHLGPVNFKVESLILDVDAVTGNLYLANGCGAAPGQLLYRYNPVDFADNVDYTLPPLISNNTNFIARKTGNKITIDGKILPEEWKDTGHRYFYLGKYKKHRPSEPHKEPYYYAEVWMQIDDENIYFAIKTDTPYWIALMFKDDANLGMLGAYNDAKVIKSDGEVSDRYFTQRQDKTFYLQNDDSDHVIAKGHHQNDYYTYEFAFPLKTYDSQDVSFEIGKAYNMLLVVGNTLEHYGIFTLDKAHANHDHSKNNKEHVDVWASNETTFRIGTPADRDIFGNPVMTTFNSYVSGFDMNKSENHFHYVNSHLKHFNGRSSLIKYITWFSILMGFTGVGFIFFRLRVYSGECVWEGHAGFNLMNIDWFRRFVTWKYFRFIFILPTLIIFLLIIFFGMFDIQDGHRNIATVFTWTLWWSLIIFALILLGRFWCMMCPFAAIGDFAQKIISFNKTLPRWLQNMNLQTIGFLVLTWAFTILAFGSSPFITAIVILIILTAAIVFSMIYQRRSFCRHLCPVGAVIGIYSMLSPIELHIRNKRRCEIHNKKTCREVCPMLESPETMDNNIYCNFCMRCQPACPSQNLELRFRSFGKDVYNSFRKSYSEAFAALFLLSVVVVETLAMTSSWKTLENNVSVFIGTNSPLILYTIVFILVLLLPVGSFYLVCYLLRLWLGKDKYKTQEIFTPFAFLLIPLGVGLHLAHNIQHLLIESPVAVPATIRFLQNMGIGTSLSVNWNPSPLLGLQPIFLIQMSTLFGGFAFTLYLLYRLLKRFKKPINHIYKMAFAISLYAIVIVLSSIYMLGLPMSGRHVH